MFRRQFVATGGLLLCGGCLSGSGPASQADSTFVISNERDTELEVSVRLRDDENAFAVEGLTLAGGETARFEQPVPDELSTMDIVAKIRNPETETYEQRIRAGVPRYIVRIRPDGIEATWDED
jgi:predicted component of type VI protein secretion system